MVGIQENTIQNMRHEINHNLAQNQNHARDNYHIPNL